MDFQYFTIILLLIGVTLSSTGIALALDLGQHSGTNLTYLHDHSLTTAFRTFLDIAHDDLAIDGKLDCLAVVQVFERYLERMIDRGSLAWPTTATTTSKEHTEQVFPTRSGRSTIITNSFESILVVGSTLLGVAQNFVGCIDFLEFVLISALVRMVCSTKLAVGLLNFLRFNVFLNFECLVKLCRVHIAATPTTTGHSTAAVSEMFKRYSTKHDSYAIFM
mmetsp:Transcript_14494/g.21306  ORF Transcript_14494/g.21306 Transcript_14494/m.21306 type:complete len:220 (+) Transcript_14494:812-1471(+)